MTLYSISNDYENRWYSQTPLFRGFWEENFKAQKPRNRADRETGRKPIYPSITQIYWSNWQHRPPYHLSTLQNTQKCFHLLCKAILSIKIRSKDDKTALKWPKTGKKLIRPRRTGRKILVLKNRETGGDRETGGRETGGSDCITFSLQRRILGQRLVWRCDHIYYVYTINYV